MTDAEYLAEYKRLAVAIKRNSEADYRLTGQMEKRPGVLTLTPPELNEWDRLGKERDRIYKERDYLVRHWPEMPSPIPGV